ncbi:ribosomal protein L5 domain-containing protein [Coniochaeta sp. 2T2.1]|nr:ribosomal protein L5 domain-containing protein [Coniochaeta sp. 2T2.1]
MAALQAPRALRCLRLSPISQRAVTAASPLYQTRSSSAAAAAETPAPAQPEFLDIELDSGLTVPGPTSEIKEAYKPWKRQMERKKGLPGSRYQYHPPKFNRGPLHPIQSPPSSDPVARDFIPGPFNIPRIRHTYESTIASDIMTLTYLHVPPGTEKRTYTGRLRSWDDSSPYHKNRPLRGPRGHSALPLIERDITFNNIPEIQEVTIDCFVPAAIKDDDYLLVARTMLLAISGQMPELTKTRKSVVQWGLTKDKKAGVKVTIRGDAALEFVDRCVQFVFPRIKEWKGLSGTTGDSSGNISWGFNAEDMALFPEIEVNNDMYPAKMLPGCRVFVKTTATSDRQARLLFQTLGIPFYGKLNN